MIENIEFRYLVTAPDLNSHGTLHGGVLLRWADEAAGMHSRKITNRVCVTRFIREVEFNSKVRLGEILRITTQIKHIGTTSITFSLDVKEDISNRQVAKIGDMVFVSIDNHGNTVKHKLKKII
jgi:acyl-CoA hydrolase